MKYTYTEERRKKMSKVRTGMKHSEATKKKISQSEKGKIVSIETRLKISQSLKNSGYKHSLATRKKMSLSKKGSKSHLWRGGLTLKNKLIRQGLEYRNWRKAVFTRDNHCCVICKDPKKLKLNADHIKPFAAHPEARFDVSNGRTLCVDCHKNTETYGWKTRWRYMHEKNGMLREDSKSDFDQTKKAEYIDELGFNVADEANKDKLKKPIKFEPTKE